eukprot:scaffold261741_cov28-Tisochrysis_lutea.AAC.1
MSSSVYTRGFTPLSTLPTATAPANTSHSMYKSQTPTHEDKETLNDEAHAAKPQARNCAARTYFQNTVRRRQIVIFARKLRSAHTLRIPRPRI